MVKLVCPADNPRAEGLECTKTCQNYDLECVSTGCVSGCLCPPGMVRAQILYVFPRRINKNEGIALEKFPGLFVNKFLNGPPAFKLDYYLHPPQGGSKSQSSAHLLPSSQGWTQPPGRALDSSFQHFLPHWRGDQGEKRHRTIRGYTVV